MHIFFLSPLFPFFPFSLPLFPFLFPCTLFPFLTLYPCPLCSPCSRPPICLRSLAHPSARRPPFSLAPLSTLSALPFLTLSHHTPTNSNQLPKTHPYRPIYQYIYNITQTKTIKFYLFSPYLSALSRPSVRPFSLLFLTLTPINSKQSPKQSKKQSRKMGTKKV